jgi:SnoaL-like domain
MRTPTVTYEQVVEGIRTAQATYAQALDDGRTDDVADIYARDGTADIEGVGVFAGRDAVRAAYSGWKPTRPQRHLVSNLLVADWGDDEAQATTDVVLIQLQDSGWVIHLVARYHDIVRLEDGTWRFVRRTIRFAGSEELARADGSRGERDPDAG